ncbi:MAG: putative inorganic carbon transporter subunit DabA, partial [Myxococcota bacterium]
MLPHASRHDDTPAFDLDALVDTATRRIAPTWPLDRFIAVNPLWGFVEKPLPEVAGRLEALVGSRMLMPRAWYRSAWTTGRLRPTHLRAAIERSGSERTVARLETLLEHDAHTPRRRPLMTDVMDATRDLEKSLAWADVVPGAISRVCAAHFTAGGGPGLWEAWRTQAPEDQSAELLVGGASLRPHAASLPTSRDGLLRLAVAELDVEPPRLEDYLTALLLDVNGWASMCAYERFQAELEGESDDLIVDLLAIRLAWELLLFRAGGPRLASRWQLAMAGWPTFDDAAEERLDDWLLQTAMEVAYQSEIAEGLTRGVAAPRPEAPRAQAAFCIDVRSEVFRRALEATSADVGTLGFAGFFGLPAAYHPIGTDASRPQLPGLLAPAVRVTDEALPEGTDARRAARLDRGAVATAFQKSAIGGFPFVEALGLGFGAKLLANAFGLARPVRHPEAAGLRHAEHHARRPRLTAKADGSPLGTEERVDLAEGILRAMSLTRGFARIVALVGHGSQTANNPHAAGYDCGACCGQAGAVNARATADLLDDPAVREGLRARGIDIPEATRFLGGLHDTTTDEVTLFDTERLG